MNLKVIKLITCTAIIFSLTSCVQADKSVSSENKSLTSEYVTNESEITEKSGEDIVITLAMSGDSGGIEKTIAKFNELDNGCKVDIKRYEAGYEQEELNLNDFEILQNIFNTADIDVVCNASFFNESYYKILQNKGAFIDLYTMMENDDAVNKSTLNNHILNVNEIDGKLYTLPVFYEIVTLSGDSKYVGNKENWNVDDFISCWENMSGDCTIDGGNQKESVYNVLLRGNLNSFIDYEKSEVHFDSDEFKKILEFCNNSFDSNYGEKSTYNYDIPRLVTQRRLTGIMSSGVFSDENRETLVGYPSSDGNGAYFSSTGLCYSINAKSSPEKQKAAWEFIRTFATEEWQIENVIPLIKSPGGDYYSTETGFCVNQNAFDKIAEKLINKEYYPTTYVDKDVTYEQWFPTQNEYDKLCSYINSVNKWGIVVDNSLWEIIENETGSYFNGEQSLNDCIAHIQNRASIWISEQS